MTQGKALHIGEQRVPGARSPSTRPVPDVSSGPLEAATEPEAAPTPAPAKSSSVLLEWGAAVVPPVTVLTGLGVWYGYELSLARGRYFGLDPTVIDFSTREYVLRAVVAVLGPMLVLMVALGGLLAWHLLVRWVLRREHVVDRWMRGVRVVGVALVVGGVVLLVQGLRAVASSEVLPEQPVVRTLLVGAGALALSYGTWMVAQASPSRRRAGPGDTPRRGPLTSEPTQLWHQVGYLVALGAVVVSVFWAFSVAAEQRGASDAELLHARGFDLLPGVVVYSAAPLALEGDGVTRSAVVDAGDAFRWRYDGLRLLVRSDDRYFMVPVGWDPGESTAIVLEEADGLRFEFETPEALR